MVTFVWNKEDVIDVYASQFEPGETYPLMDTPNHHPAMGGPVMFADQVLSKDGTLIGISSGRAYSQYYREMISLCSIDVEHGAINNEVIVLWGDPGTHQKKIHAKVSRFPYLNEDRNESVDVSKIPCITARK
jgi:vanillate/3-O-methylgallate O-demethylase